MNKRYLFLIVGGAILLAFLLFHSCQGRGAVPVTPEALTSIPTAANTATLKAQTTSTPTFRPSATIPTDTATPEPQASSTSAPQRTATPIPTKDPVQEINWQWVNIYSKLTGQIVYVPDPAGYTIIFHADGTVSGQADCNTYRGTYSDENGLSIQITTSTRAVCAEGSLEQEYLDLLNNVVAGGPDGAGNLALENAGGEKRMLFRNGGPAGE